MNHGVRSDLSEKGEKSGQQLRNKAGTVLMPNSTADGQLVGGVILTESFSMGAFWSLLFKV